MEESHQIYELVTVTRTKNKFSGSSIKLKNFEFKIRPFIEAMVSLYALSQNVDKVIYGIGTASMLYGILSSVKIKIEESESFILFSLHNSGLKKFSFDDAFAILNKDWALHPKKYSQSRHEFMRSLRNLEDKKIITFEEEEVCLIEEIRISYD